MTEELKEINKLAEEVTVIPGMSSKLEEFREFQSFLIACLTFVKLFTRPKGDEKIDYLISLIKVL